MPCFLMRLFIIFLIKIQNNKKIISFIYMWTKEEEKKRELNSILIETPILCYNLSLIQ